MTEGQKKVRNVKDHYLMVTIALFCLHTCSAVISSSFGYINTGKNDFVYFSPL